MIFKVILFVVCLFFEATFQIQAQLHPGFSNRKSKPRFYQRRSLQRPNDWYIGLFLLRHAKS